MMDGEGEGVLVKEGKIECQLLVKTRWKMKKKKRRVSGMMDGERKAKKKKKKRDGIMTFALPLLPQGMEEKVVFMDLALFDVLLPIPIRFRTNQVATEVEEVGKKATTRERLRVGKFDYLRLTNCFTVLDGWLSF